MKTSVKVVGMGLVALFVGVFGANSSARSEEAHAAKAPLISQAPTARIVRMNTVHNVIRNGEKGMLIQIDANVDNIPGRDVTFAAYFFFKDGKRLPSLPGAGKYGTPDGQVTTQLKDVPKFQATRFTNVELFVPYYELTGGISPLDFYYQVEIQWDDGVRTNNLLSRSGNQHFNVR